MRTPGTCYYTKHHLENIDLGSLAREPTVRSPGSYALLLVRNVILEKPALPFESYLIHTLKQEINALFIYK